MTAHGADFMPLNRQLFSRSIAEALAELLAQKYRTAKALAKQVGIDPATAENLRKGHLSVPTLEKTLAAEGRELWERLGDEIFGGSYDEHLQHMIEETRRAADRLESRRARVRDLEARARRLADLGAGMAP